MTPGNLQHRILRLVGALVAAGSIFLAACGDGSSTETAGIGGTGIGVGGTGIVSGKITGFGSVHVNGGKFEIDSSRFDVDGDTGADQSDLALGMVVRLRVETENGVFTNKAIEVVYDDEVEGPVTSVMTPDPMNPAIKTGIVFGQTVTFDEGSTIFEDTSFGSIGEEDVLLDPDVIEVSGFTSASGISATYVRFIEDLQPGVTEGELRGNISTLAGSPPNQTFMIGTTNITTDGSTVLDVPGGGLLETQYVEVKGKISNPSAILATKIEEEDEDFDDDVDDIDLQGIVLIYNGINNFFIGSQHVDASTAKFSPASLRGMNLMGMNIEVEGEIVAGRLIADEVEARDGDTKLRASIFGTVNTVSNSFEVTYPVATGPTTVVVKTNGQTLFEDETNTPPVTVPFSLDDLMATDFVRVEGQEVGGEVVASVVKRTDGTGQGLKLEGAVDSFVTDSSVTILGIIYDVDPAPGGTEFEDFADSAAFFGALNPLGGDFVEIEDDDVADGVADEVELE